MRLRSGTLASMGITALLLVALFSPASSQGKGGGGGKPPKDEDNSAPVAVADLAVAAVSADTVTLTWTASADDGSDPASGPASGYDVRFSTSQITDANWNDAQQALEEPTPGAPGSSESFLMLGPLPDTSYYVGLKVTDDAGNESELSNVVSTATDAGDWSIGIVDTGYFYLSLAFDPTDGNPSMGYGTDDHARFADWNGSSWDTEEVDGGATNVDHGYSPSGVPGMAYLKGGQRKKRLMFAERVGSTWDLKSVDTGLYAGSGLSLAYDAAGSPALAYASTSLKFARWDGSSFVTEEVDGEFSSFPSLAYDSAGNPAISYRLSDGSGGIEALKFASWNGSSWEIETIDTSAGRMGIYSDLAIDPMTDYPAISFSRGFGSSCGDGRTVEVARWDGAAWNLEVIDGPIFHCFFYTSIAFSASGTPYVAYGECTRGSPLPPRELQVAHYNGTSWVVEVAQATWECNLGTSLAIGPSGLPSIGYRDESTPVKQIRIATMRP